MPTCLYPDNLSRGLAALRGLVAAVVVVPILKRRTLVPPVNPRVSLTFGKALDVSARGRVRLSAHVDWLLDGRSRATTAELASAMVVRLQLGRQGPTGQLKPVVIRRDRHTWRYAARAFSAGRRRVGCSARSPKPRHNSRTLPECP